jgi:hypothetical protein
MRGTTEDIVIYRQNQMVSHIRFSPLGFWPYRSRYEQLKRVFGLVCTEASLLYGDLRFIDALKQEGHKSYGEKKNHSDN